MSKELLMRGFCSALFGLALSYLVFSRHQAEAEDNDSKSPRYLPYISGSLLPLFLMLAAALYALFRGIAGAARLTLSLCFGIFLHITLYYAVLLFLLPLFRKAISARACALLWIIPNYLYIASQSYMALPEPWLVIPVSGNWVWLLFFLWLAGFLTVMSCKITEHLLFRRRILAGSAPVATPEILSLWEKMMTESRMKEPKFPLIVSPAVKAPLSVGLFKRTVKVVLPAKNYSMEEWELILKHELIHIARQDSWSKYFLVFCTAMCWFNPFMWAAMRKSAEDMELSCDETVLLEADEESRKKYAFLLLNTAGEERGFTTRLSGSAKSLRYRLKHIMRPVWRRSGAAAVGITFFVLCMTSGYVALAYGGRSGAERIYHNGDCRQYTLRSLSAADKEHPADYEITNEAAFHSYLSGLTLSELTGNYSFPESGMRFSFLMDAPDGTLWIRLYDDVIALTPLPGAPSYYYIADGTDWEYLNTIIKASGSMRH